MSHYFRRRASILGLHAQFAEQRTGPVADPQRKSLTRIDSNSRHLLALINDILDITRIEAGRMPLNATSFGIGELFDEVQAELEPIIKRSNLAVTTKVRGPVPSVRSDRQKVKQIVLNLLSNALKFTPAGSVTMTRLDAENGRSPCSERYRGRPSAKAGKVFEDLRKATRAARGYGGPARMSICAGRKILGGTIELESPPARARPHRGYREGGKRDRSPPRSRAPLCRRRGLPDAREITRINAISGSTSRRARQRIDSDEKTRDLCPNRADDLALPRMEVGSHAR